MQPLIWLGILALLLVVEAITAGLTTIWFAGGALVAAIACYAGANLTVQILLFLCVSLVLLIFTRPLAMKYFNKETIQTNANSLIGKKAVVIQEIDNLAQTGQVRINDIEWTARSADDEKIGEGTLGLDAIARIINHPLLKDLPFYLETPNELPGYEKEIALLKSLREA